MKLIFLKNFKLQYTVLSKCLVTEFITLFLGMILSTAAWHNRQRNKHNRPVPSFQQIQSTVESGSHHLTHLPTEQSKYPLDMDMYVTIQ